MADDVTPGYLVVDLSPEGVCVGGLMVTDENGLPLDFRFTDPITPTRLQRVLYGGALERYLRADVVAGTLLSSIEVLPTVLFVDDEALLDPPKAECPVGMVQTTRLPPLGPAGTVKGEHGHALVQPADDVAPVRVTAVDDATVAAVTPSLVAVGARMDAVEPLDRVRRALGLISSGEMS
jgi:hypothetical protein